MRPERHGVVASAGEDLGQPRGAGGTFAQQLGGEQVGGGEVPPEERQRWKRLATLGGRAGGGDRADEIGVVGRVGCGRVSAGERAEPPIEIAVIKDGQRARCLRARPRHSPPVSAHEQRREKRGAGLHTRPPISSRPTGLTIVSPRRSRDTDQARPAQRGGQTRSLEAGKSS